MTSGSVKNGGRHIRTPRILATAVAVLIMLAFKRHYSLATAGQLDWILAPTATLLAWLTPAQPVYESGVGYVDFARGIIVAPACAGVNFMIMTFGLGALCGLVNIRRTGPMWAWLPLSLAGAFGYTIIINTVRIFLSMMLYKADIYGGWVTVERIHRFGGIVIYLSALLFFFMGCQSLVRSRQRCRGATPPGLPVWLPLCWYVVGAAGVPMASLLLRKRAPLLSEHIVTVLITAPCVWGITVWIHRLVITALRRRHCENHEAGG